MKSTRSTSKQLKKKQPVRLQIYSIHVHAKYSAITCTLSTGKFGWPLAASGRLFQGKYTIYKETRRVGRRGWGSKSGRSFQVAAKRFLTVYTFHYRLYKHCLANEIST